MPSIARQRRCLRRGDTQTALHSLRVDFSRLSSARVSARGAPSCRLAHVRRSKRANRPAWGSCRCGWSVLVLLLLLLLRCSSVTTEGTSCASRTYARASKRLRPRHRARSIRELARSDSLRVRSNSTSAPTTASHSMPTSGRRLDQLVAYTPRRWTPEEVRTTLTSPLHGARARAHTAQHAHACAPLTHFDGSPPSDATHALCSTPTHSCARVHRMRSSVKACASTGPSAGRRSQG